MIPILPNPFADLAGAAANAAAQAWISVMLVIWNAGLWFLRVVLNFMDAFLTPDISEGGPGAQVYKVTFWIGGTLMLILSMVQLGVAGIRRDGKSLAQILIGVFQFAMVWVGVLTYATAVLAAAGGLTTAFMESLLNVTKWNDAQFFSPFEVKDVTNGVLATILGLMGLLLVVAAIGHFFIMVTRAGAILVLIASAPIAAAGLVGNVGQSWFWKTMRWFHAAAFTPPLVVLIMGIGVQFTTGVAVGGSGLEGSIGTAVPGVLLICGSVVAPVALFKLFSFVDPGTATGAAVRQGLAAEGGLQGLLQGHSPVGSSAASATTGNGRSAGEASAEDQQAARVNGVTGGGHGAGGAGGGIGSALAGAGGGLARVGGALAAGVGAMTRAGHAAVGVGADLTNQMGVGHNTYYPDMGGGGPVIGPNGQVVGTSPSNGGGNGGGGDDGGYDDGAADGGAADGGAGQPTVLSAGPSSGGPGGPSFSGRRGAGAPPAPPAPPASPAPPVPPAPSAGEPSTGAGSPAAVGGAPAPAAVPSGGAPSVAGPAAAQPASPSPSSSAGRSAAPGFQPVDVQPAAGEPTVGTGAAPAAGEAATVEAEVAEVAEVAVLL